MGVDYIVGLECSVKEEYSTDVLVGIIKQRNGAQMILDQFRERGDHRPPSEINYTSGIITPEGMQEVECNLGEMMEKAEGLKAWESHCTNCPANHTGEPFGCWGYLNFPITEAQEQWLMSRLPANLDSTIGGLLSKAIADFGYKGEPVRDMRRRGDTFLIRKSPVIRKWGGFFSGKKLNSNQILQSILLVGPIEPTHSLLQCLFLGLAPENLSPDDLVRIMTDPESRQTLLKDIDPRKEFNPEIAQMKQLLRALRIAAITEQVIYVDA